MNFIYIIESNLHYLSQLIVNASYIYKINSQHLDGKYLTKYLSTIA